MSVSDCQSCGRLMFGPTCECEEPNYVDRTGTYFDVSVEETAVHLTSQGFKGYFGNDCYKVYFSANATPKALRLQRKQVHTIVAQFSKGRISSIRGSDEVKEKTDDRCRRCENRIKDRCGAMCCGDHCCCDCDRDKQCPESSGPCVRGFNRVFNLVIIYDPLRHRPKITKGEKNHKMIVDSKLKGWVLMLAQKFGNADCPLRLLPKDVLFMIIRHANSGQKMRRRPQRFSKN